MQFGLLVEGAIKGKLEKRLMVEVVRMKRYLYYSAGILKMFHFPVTIC
jgi:hypothetical protein